MSSKIVEKQVIQDLVKNINNKETKLDDENAAHTFHDKNLCKAAVRLTTYGKAYEYRLNNKEVYLVNEEGKNGSRKTNAYIRCSKSASKEGCNLCHIHERTFKNDESSVKIFDTDVMPKDSSDKTKWLANLKDDFFDNMRKKKKKESTNSFIFPNEADPILLILNNKKSKISSLLYKYATQLLKDIDIKNSTKQSDKNDKKDTKESNNSNKSSKSSKSSKKIIKSTQEVSDNEKDEENLVSDSDNNHDHDSDSSDNDSNRSDNENENEDDDEESNELEIDSEIKTNDGQTFYLKDDTVYKSHDNGDCIMAGTLIETPEKYHTVIHEGKFYSIYLTQKHYQKGDLYICIITNKVFNTKFKLIGNAIKKNDHYELKFKSDKI